MLVSFVRPLGTPKGMLAAQGSTRAGYHGTKARRVVCLRRKRGERSNFQYGRNRAAMHVARWKCVALGRTVLQVRCLAPAGQSCWWREPKGGRCWQLGWNWPRKRHHRSNSGVTVVMIPSAMEAARSTS